MRNVRYIFRLLSAFVGRFKGLILIGLAIGILLFTLINFILPVILLKKTERVGLAGRYHPNNLPGVILNLIGDGLTKVETDGTVVPNLAESWETPDRGKTWIFTIKEGLFWQNGDPLDSQTLSYEFSDVEIEYPDSKTIIFKLKDPFSPFPGILSEPVFKKGLLGTGEWSVQKITISSGIVQKLVLKDPANNKKVFKFYPTQERAKLAYKLGEVDSLLELFDPLPFIKWRTAKVSSDVEKNRVVSLFFNTEDRLLSDKSARQALVYAIDKNSFDSQRAISPISPNSWAFNPLVKKYPYNTDRAKELLKDFPKEILEQPVKLVTTPILLPVAEKVADYWSLIGVNTVVQVSSVIPDEFQAYLTILDIPSDPDQYVIWHSTQKGTNISKYSNPRIDKLLEDGRLALDFEERRKIYLDFQRFLLEDSPAVFLYHPAIYTVTRK